MVSGPDLALQAAQSQATAAWVQAVFSVVAIFAAGLFPAWLERAKGKARRKEWLTKLAALTFEVRDMAAAIANAYESDQRLYSTRMAGNPEEFAPVAEAVASFPSYNLTDRLHLVALLHLRRYAVHVDRIWRDIFTRSSDEAPLFWEDTEDTKALATELSAFADGVAAFK